MTHKRRSACTLIGRAFALAFDRAFFRVKRVLASVPYAHNRPPNAPVVCGCKDTRAVALMCKCTCAVLLTPRVQIRCRAAIMPYAMFLRSYRLLSVSKIHNIRVRRASARHRSYPSKLINHAPAATIRYGVCGCSNASTSSAAGRVLQSINSVTREPSYSSKHVRTSAPDASSVHDTHTARTQTASCCANGAGFALIATPAYCSFAHAGLAELHSQTCCNA